MLVEDCSIAADNEGFRYPIDTPIDSRASGTVHANGDKRIPVTADEAPCRFGAVLIVDAEQRGAAECGDLDKNRMKK